MKALVLIFFVLALAMVARGADEMSVVVGEIERINSLRESLVAGVQAEVTKETFRAVCKPVGAELKKMATQHGYKVSQVALKYRNPSHKPNKMQTDILNKMTNNRDLLSLWQTGPEGKFYFRRINVQAACLNCHGSKDSRPDFIKQEYKSDKAYGFNIGDLRAIYSVFIPKK